MKLTLRICSGLLVVWLGLLFGTATDAAELRPWTTMNAGAYAPTVSAAHGQCVDMGYGVATCDELSHFLDNRQLLCRQMAIPDGVPYHLLGGADGISKDRIKQLGSSKSAWVCTLSGNITFHWFEGYTEACNNLAVPFTRSEITRWVEPGSFHLVQSLNYCGCYILPGQVVFIPPSKGSSELLTESIRSE